MEIAYSKCGDYYISDLALTQDEKKPISKYGRMRKQYLKEQHPVIYSNLLLSEKLYPHLLENNDACERRMEQLILQMVRREGVTEALKASNQMAWVGKMNSIHIRAEEIILHELVYTEEAEYAGS